jgi:hypothetical protein
MRKLRSFIYGETAVTRLVGYQHAKGEVSSLSPGCLDTSIYHLKDIFLILISQLNNSLLHWKDPNNLTDSVQNGSELRNQWNDLLDVPFPLCFHNGVLIGRRPMYCPVYVVACGP